MHTWAFDMQLESLSFSPPARTFSIHMADIDLAETFRMIVCVSISDIDALERQVYHYLNYNEILNSYHELRDVTRGVIFAFFSKEEHQEAWEAKIKDPLYSVITLTDRLIQKARLFNLQHPELHHPLAILYNTCTAILENVGLLLDITPDLFLHRRELASIYYQWHESFVYKVRSSPITNTIDIIDIRLDDEEERSLLSCGLHEEIEMSNCSTSSELPEEQQVDLSAEIYSRPPVEQTVRDVMGKPIRREKKLFHKWKKFQRLVKYKMSRLMLPLKTKCRQNIED
ncbi:hypothetical protein NEOLI_002786 [Neolecta irregularis DAH-3]|uniref:Uncharacterized protein n=1 Tax=Neolecta irregularis (strain DAH-3) TaxID=1198029 RepID=A0A1U7LNW3_NEOID|nr:hypothetical protein NEOLI_002786 [Neolecta irregularis DAH-3]|eukprot:OLL24360.1 hypothetical protein NEOLI_002786 [Neolecta irregularis DAH-3]